MQSQAAHSDVARRDSHVMVPCLSAEEAAWVTKQIFALERHWCERYKLHTLGVTAHMDLIGSYDQGTYVAAMRRGNGLLTGHFGWLYARVIAVLEDFLAGPVALATDHPVPGFMIYQGPVIGPIEERSHVDLQFELHDWSHFERVDFANLLTFTVAVSLPRFTTGMKVWPCEQHSRLRSRFTLVEPRFGGLTHEVYVPYQVGKMVIHSGTFVHALDNAVDDPDPTPRITLQGHALRCDDVWRLYW